MSTNKLFIHPFSIAFDRDDQMLEIDAEFISDAWPLRLTVPFAAVNVHLRNTDETISIADCLAMSLDDDETESLPERDGQKEEQP